MHWKLLRSLNAAFRCPGPTSPKYLHVPQDHQQVMFLTLSFEIATIITIMRITIIIIIIIIVVVVVVTSWVLELGPDPKRSEVLPP